MKPKKFKKIVEWDDESKMFRAHFVLLVLFFLYFLFSVFYLTSLNPAYEDNFFPVGAFVIAWLVCILIWIRSAFERKVYWREVK